MKLPAADPLLSAGERQQLLQLCRCWTGDADAAEDLVQETLLIGWQQLAGAPAYLRIRHIEQELPDQI